MGLYEALKDAVSVAQKADNIEIMRALFEAQKQALDVLDLLREKDDIIRALEKEVDRLKESVRIRGNVKEWQGWFFLVDEDKNWKYPPICPRCWQVDARIVYLNRISATNSIMRCLQCNSTAGHMPSIPKDAFQDRAA